MIFIFLIILFVYLAISLFTNNTISTEIYELRTPLLSEQSSIKIVLISDLHSGIHGKGQNKLIEKIKNSDPDLIVLAGDIFDSIFSMSGAELLLSNISNIAPIYYVTGNHEYRSNNIQTIREKLLSYKIVILSDTYKTIMVGNNEIILAGIEDPDKRLHENINYNQTDSMEKAFRELDEMSLYKILLAHRPENIETYKKYSFNLILSGHTHGGQIRIPNIINGLYAPNQGIFPKYAGGIYYHGNITHIISRGLSIKFMLPRIFNPPELVIITIKSEI